MPLQAPWDSQVRAGDYRPQLSKLEGGGRVPDDFVCNGNSYVKDTFGSIDTTPAGIIHDYDFSIGGGIPEFLSANARYRRNLVACGFPRFAAFVRCAGVHLGVAHFNWRRDPARKLGLFLLVFALLVVAVPAFAQWQGGRNQPPLPQSTPSVLELQHETWLNGLDADRDNICDAAAGLDGYLTTDDFDAIDYGFFTCLVPGNSTTCALDANAVALAAQLASNVVTRAKVADDAIGEPELDLINGDTAADEDCLTYENGTGGTLEWQACGGGVAADSVGLTELADSDFGDFTCNDSACTIDSGVLTAPAWQTWSQGSSSHSVSGTTTSAWIRPISSTQTNTAAAPIASSVFVVPAGRTLTLKRLDMTVTAVTPFSTAENCTIEVSSGSDAADLTTRSTVNSVTGNFGGDYTSYDTIKETLTLDLGETNVSAGGFVTIRLTDTDGASADTCTVATNEIQFTVFFRLQ